MEALRKQIEGLIHSLEESRADRLQMEAKNTQYETKHLKLVEELEGLEVLRKQESNHFQAKIKGNHPPWLP